MGGGGNGYRSERDCRVALAMTMWRKGLPSERDCRAALAMTMWRKGLPSERDCRAALAMTVWRKGLPSERDCRAALAMTVWWKGLPSERDCRVAARLAMTVWWKGLPSERDCRVALAMTVCRGRGCRRNGIAALLRASQMTRRNRRIGGITSPEHHPLKQFLASDAPFVIASDDPGIFGTTLADEIARVTEHHHVADDVMARIIDLSWSSRSEVLTGRLLQ